MEKRVKAYIVIAICEKCGVGELQATGLAVKSDGKRKFIHICDNCKSRVDLEKEYPYTIEAPEEEQN